MPHGLLVTLLPLFAPVLEHAPAPTRVVQDSQTDAEFERRRKDAGNDVDKLWDVYKWCKDQKKEDKGRSICRQILKLDPNFEDANLALGYVKYEDKWFPSQKKVDEYKKGQAAKAAKEAEKDGLVDFKGQRVPPEDVPFLEKGLVKDDDGTWIDAESLKRKKEGWIQQDLDWVPPTDKANIEKGLWKCDDKWLSLDDANKFHQQPYKWWRIPSEHYVLYTTNDRAFALDKIKPALDRAWDDVTKVARVEPKQRPIVVVLRSAEQYKRFASGDAAEGWPDTDPRKLSTITGAFFSERAAWPLNGEPMLAGIGFWETGVENGDKWGVHAARRALGLSYVDAIDRSFKAVEKAKKAKKFEKEFLAEFAEEKRLPEWFRSGIAAYGERYFIDIYVERGGNNKWAREWSVENIKNKGGLSPLKQIMDPKFSIKASDEAAKQMNETGLMLSFAVDGECAPVKEKLKAVTDALAANKDKKEISAAVQALADEIMKHEADLRKFAGL